MRPVQKRPRVSKEREDELVASLEWLARAAVNAGFDASAFLKASRQAFALAGHAELASAKSTSKVSTSQVSAVTGLTRKELPALISSSNAALSDMESPAWSVVWHWKNSPKYREKSGKPKVLPIDSGEGSFKSLVRELVPDVPHMSVLKELGRLGFVERGVDKVVALSSSVEKKMSQRQTRFSDISRKSVAFGESAYKSDFTKSSGELNVLKVIDQIPEKMVGLFLKNFSERAISLLAAVDKWQVANLPSSAQGDLSETVGLGVYLVRQPGPNAGSMKATSPPKPKRRAKRA